MVENAGNLPKDFVVVYDRDGNELIRVASVMKVMIGENYTAITYRGDDASENRRLTTNLPFIYNE